MADKRAPRTSPRPRPRPGVNPVSSSPVPRSREDGMRSQFLRGMNRNLREEEETTRPRRMKNGGMCRGMGKATRGGRYGKSG